MQLQCIKCEKQFIKKPKASPKTKYCEECRWIKCSVCGKEKRLTTQQLDNPTWGRFCSHKCEKANSNFRFKKNGYWCIKAEDHPRAYEKGYYYEHILVAEEKIGRLLDTSIETVHHIDGDRLNNRPENLEVKTRVEHAKHHWPAVSTSEEVGIDHAQYSDIRKPKPLIYKSGYKYVYDPENPMSDHKGYVSLARKVMSEKIGRTLNNNEVVFYKDGDKANLEPDNLEIKNRKYSFKKAKQYKSNNPNKGYSKEDGYSIIWKPDHPMARKTGYILEHRLIMAEHLGRNLEPYEHVHHINGNRLDNRIENLEVVHRKDHPSKHFQR